jgi:hypothetical protein
MKLKAVLLNVVLLLAVMCILEAVSGQTSAPFCPQDRDYGARSMCAVVGNLDGHEKAVPVGAAGSIDIGALLVILDTAKRGTVNNP